MGAIEESLKRLPTCKLVVVDPIGSFLGGRTDAHRDNAVRSVLTPIAMLSEKYRTAVLVVAHRRKSEGRSADDLALGSRAFTGIARAVWHLTRDKENKERRLLLPGKNNLSRFGHGLAFSITGEPARITWEPEPVAMSADDALADDYAHGVQRMRGPDACARKMAATWLLDLLCNGPMETKKVREEAIAAGFSWRTVHRAKDALGIRPMRNEFSGPWFWELPTAYQVATDQHNLASWHDSENA